MALLFAAARSRSSALGLLSAAKHHSSDVGLGFRAISCTEAKPSNHASSTVPESSPDMQQRSPLPVLQQRLRLGFQFTETKMGHRACYSTAAAATSPSPGASASEYILGRADAAGTAGYAHKIGSAAAPGHFRSLRVGGSTGDLVVSSIGMGTFGGSDTDGVDREYIESITRGLSLGINLIDCASNYRNMRSELAVGKCLSMAIKQGIINRNEVIVCSKAGFLSFDYREDIDPYTYIDNKYIHTNLFTREEFVGGCHCLSPNFLKNQVDISRRNLGLDVIDIYFVHNPETQLNIVSKNTVYNRIRAAFRAMEECCDAGKITAYGVATWNAFRVNQSGKQHVPLEELVNYAREIAGENHHFKVVQAPFNGKLQEAANQATQAVRGKRMPLLHAAHHLGLSVIASSSLDQGHLCKNLNPEIRNKCPEVGEQRTDGQSALQFVRTAPGVMSALVGMRSGIHLEENAALIKVPANARS